MRDLIIAQAVAILMLVCGTAFAGQSYLVGDMGVIKPDLKGILIAQDRPMPEVIEHTPVVERSKSDGVVTVTSCIEFNGSECVPAEEAGFFSIVKSTDKD